MAHILLTGSAGSIGRCIGPSLIETGHTVRGYDRQPTPWTEDALVADLTDRGAMADALRGIDTVVHLAANPSGRASFDELLQPNYIGPRQLVELAAEAGTPQRLILASTIQVYGGAADLPQEQRARLGRPEDAVPNNDYALSKVWLERLGEWSARRHGWSVLAVRIGWFLRDPKESRSLDAKPSAHAWYFSHEDARTFFRAAVEADYAGFHVVNATSQPKPGRANCSLQPAADTLGWAPQSVFEPSQPAD
ncbi:MAG: NAD(P)-dependent oxidoreductase [Planctomycetota bacterium]